MKRTQRFYRRALNGLWLGTLLAGLSAAAVAAAPTTVRAYRSEITLPTYPWAAVKHPYFRGTDGRNIYPYPMLDYLSRDKTNRTYQTVVLENQYLRITFLPALGGKVFAVRDKTTGKPMFYVNHVVKPGLIGECGAWTSGGIEWNTGPQGHTVSCMEPVDVVILPPARDGSRSVAIGETERIYNTQWTVVVTLRPNRAFIEERIRIDNPTETVRPYYFWNDTAMPNTPGFRFIYPMTLGMNHTGSQFFHWPIDHGKDLSRAIDYQDAASIFAYRCNQNFFGAYLDDRDYGIVSCANHYQLRGKKAWTWGQGSYGTMHEMDLTDTDGPYNEVQTGPLLTQGEVGRLDPCEAVEWREWWYPIHGIGGFTYANRNVAVNATEADGKLQLRMLGTGTWDPVEVTVRNQHGQAIQRAHGRLSPHEPTELNLPLAGAGKPLHVELRAGKESLAQFRVPLKLPVRTPPPPKPKPVTAAQLAQAGWNDYLFAHFPAAKAKFNQALAKDTHSVSAHTGLAYLQLVCDPAAARRAATAALATDSFSGLAQFALAVASLDKDPTAALNDAWKAALDPATAVPARALVAEILIRRHEWRAAVNALAEAGPWQTNPLCRNRRADALLRLGETQAAVRLARANLRVNPLDGFAATILWRAQAPGGEKRLNQAIAGKAQPVLDVAADLVDLHQYRVALDVLQHFYLDRVPAAARDPIVCYWAAFLATKQPGDRAMAQTEFAIARHLPAADVFPHRLETVTVLRAALAHDPRDGFAALYLGHVLFHLGRHAQGRAMWQRAAKLGAEPVIAYRALGMASLTLDHDPVAAQHYLEQAHTADPHDPIVARDLARVLLDLANRATSEPKKRAFWTEARDELQAAFAAGKGRSDFVALLAEAQNRLGDYAATARMLDSVRVTVWEGAHEVHDLFAAAHVALGKADLAAHRPAAALAQFNRALEYPKNLATGRLEGTPEAQIQYLRGNALAALNRSAEARAAWQKAADEPPSSNPADQKARRLAKAALAKK